MTRLCQRADRAVGHFVPGVRVDFSQNLLGHRDRVAGRFAVKKAKGAIQRATSVAAFQGVV